MGAVARDSNREKQCYLKNTQMKVGDMLIIYPHHFMEIMDNLKLLI